MTATSLKISKTLSLPLSFVTLTQAILAKKGAGKTYCASVEAEEMLAAKQQVIIIDPTGAWWGLKSSADGKSAGFPIAIFGGDHADIPLEDTAGDLIATAIVEQGFSAIIDLSLFRKAQLLRFMAPFLETLYLRNRNSLHLIVDEADAIAPQRPMGEDARTLGAIEDVVRRGRIRGIGCTLMTQRPQVLNKNVLTQADVLCAMRMTHPKDIGAIKEWIDVHGDPALAKDLIASLPSLPTGDAWFWAPEAGNIFERVTVRKRTTFNSSATPKPGERKIVPKVLAPVDIEQLGAKIAESVERKKQDSPEFLKKRIAELERRTIAPPPDPELQKSLALADQKLRDARQLSDRYRAALTKLLATFQELKHAWGDGFERLDTLEASAYIPAPVATPQVAKLQPPAAVNGHKPEGKLRDGAERMLAALAQWHPHGRTEAQWASQVGMKRSGGTWGTYKSDLRKAGYIEQRDGKIFCATKAGVEHLGVDAPRAPRTTQDVLDLWTPKLRSGAVQMLKALITFRDHSIERGKLAELVGMEASGGTFGTYLSDLRTTGLIVTHGALISADKEALFL